VFEAGRYQRWGVIDAPPHYGEGLVEGVEGVLLGTRSRQ
jgi:hypothetical protein